MKKLLILASAALLAACNTTGENTYYANDGYEFTPDPTKSLALNVMQAGGTTRLLKDADIPAEAWDDVSTAQYATGFTIQYLQNGILGGISSLVMNSDLDDAAPLDWPNIITWVPVSSAGFTKKLQNEAIEKNLDLLQEAIKIEGGTIRKIEPFRDGKSIYYGGSLCDSIIDNVVKTRPKYYEYFTTKKNVDPCAMTIDYEVIRPSVQNLVTNQKGTFLIVRTRIISSLDYNLASINVSGSATYLPPKWGFSLARFGTGFPSVKMGNDYYLFISPKGGQQAKLSEL